jgi:hypothetical protein
MPKRNSERLDYEPKSLDQLDGWNNTDKVIDNMSDGKTDPVNTSPDGYEKYTPMHHSPGKTSSQKDI